MTSTRKAALFACLLGLCPLAHAQRAADDAAASRVTMTVAYVESCLWMDELHRSTCAKIGANLSEKNRKLCATSDRTFAQRISVSYPAFKQRHHPTIAANEASIASAVANPRASLARHFPLDECRSRNDFAARHRERLAGLGVEVHCLTLAPARRHLEGRPVAVQRFVQTCKRRQHLWLMLLVDDINL